MSERSANFNSIERQLHRIIELLEELLREVKGEPETKGRK